MSGPRGLVLRSGEGVATVLSLQGLHGTGVLEAVAPEAGLPTGMRVRPFTWVELRGERASQPTLNLLRLEHREVEDLEDRLVDSLLRRGLEGEPRGRREALELLHQVDPLLQRSAARRILATEADILAGHPLDEALSLPPLLQRALLSSFSRGQGRDQAGCRLHLAACGAPGAQACPTCRTWLDMALGFPTRLTWAVMHLWAMREEPGKVARLLYDLDVRRNVYRPRLLHFWAPVLADLVLLDEEGAQDWLDEAASGARWPEPWWHTDLEDLDAFLSSGNRDPLGTLLSLHEGLCNQDGRQRQLAAERLRAMYRDPRQRRSLNFAGRIACGRPERVPPNFLFPELFQCAWSDESHFAAFKDDLAGSPLQELYRRRPVRPALAIHCRSEFHHPLDGIVVEALRLASPTLVKGGWRFLNDRCQGWSPVLRQRAAWTVVGAVQHLLRGELEDVASGVRRLVEMPPGCFQPLPLLTAFALDRTRPPDLRRIAAAEVARRRPDVEGCEKHLQAWLGGLARGAPEVSQDDLVGLVRPPEDSWTRLRFQRGDVRQCRSILLQQRLILAPLASRSLPPSPNHGLQEAMELMMQEDPDFFVRAAALRGRFALPGADASLLVDAMRAEHRHVRLTAIEAFFESLSAGGKEMTPQVMGEVLFRALGDGDPAVVRQALVALESTLTGPTPDQAFLREAREQIRLRLPFHKSSDRFSHACQAALPILPLLMGEEETFRCLEQMFSNRKLSQYARKHALRLFLSRPGLRSLLREGRGPGLGKAKLPVAADPLDRGVWICLRLLQHAPLAVRAGDEALLAFLEALLEMFSRSRFWQAVGRLEQECAEECFDWPPGANFQVADPEAEVRLSDPEEEDRSPWAFLMGTVKFWLMNILGREDQDPGSGDEPPESQGRGLRLLALETLSHLAQAPDNSHVYRWAIQSGWTSKWLPLRVESLLSGMETLRDWDEEECRDLLDQVRAESGRREALQAHLLSLRAWLAGPQRDRDGQEAARREAMALLEELARTPSEPDNLEEWALWSLLGALVAGAPEERQWRTLLWLDRAGGLLADPARRGRARFECLQATTATALDPDFAEDLARLEGRWLEIGDPERVDTLTELFSKARRRYPELKPVLEDPSRRHLPRPLSLENTPLLGAYLENPCVSTRNQVVQELTKVNAWRLRSLLPAIREGVENFQKYGNLQIFWLLVHGIKREIGYRGAASLHRRLQRLLAVTHRLAFRRPHVFSLGPLVDKTCRRFAARARQAGGPGLLLLPAEPARLLADSRRVSLALEELLDNAFKRSHAGAGPVEVSWTVSGSHASVRIMNHGEVVGERSQGNLSRGLGPQALEGLPGFFLSESGNWRFGLGAARSLLQAEGAWIHSEDAPGGVVFALDGLPLAEVSP